MYEYMPIGIGAYRCLVCNVTQDRQLPWRLHALRKCKLAYCHHVEACIHVDLKHEYISRLTGAHICVPV
jgi:hypothetical protein